MRLRRSIDIVSGIVMMRRLPRAAAIAARPMPVLPDVGSMRTVSSFTLPAFTASSIIAFAMRSFTEPAGLNNSTLPRMVASRLWFFSKFVSSTRGVLPISSDTLLWMVMILAFRRFLCDGIYPTMLIGFVNMISHLFSFKQKNVFPTGKTFECKC